MKSFEFIPNRARVISKAVPPQLCEQTINQIEQEFQFRPCKYGADVNTDCRDSSEVKIEDKDLTEKFWTHIKDQIPSVCDGERLVGPHFSRVYLLRYFEGQYFKKHYDGYSTSSQGHRSQITVLIYLNDMDEKCGGATRFYAEPDRQIGFVEPHDHPVFDIIPRIGTMVLFTHQLLHEGMPIKLGYKYCIRFNILYTVTPSEVFPADYSDLTQNNTPELKVPIMFHIVPYEYPFKVQKIKKDSDVSTNPSEYNEMPIYIDPDPNRLKYKKTKFRTYDRDIVTLTKSPSNRNSQNRWNDIALRPHVFDIQRAEFPGFVDTTMGRPPTWEEDFCPNCYEILPLVNTYQNCPGCTYPVLSIDEERRKYNLSLGKL